jgi:glycosyltransferase involved in cell wall biosynthesis
MENKTLVSVIIPVFNCENYLEEAIESVLAQTYQTFEIIVVDDGSTDESAEVVKRFGPPVRYYYQPNAGTGAARNRGVSLAQGGFLAFLDADDVWLKKKLELQISAFVTNPDSEIVFGHVKQFYSPDLSIRLRKKIRCTPELVPGYLPSTMLIKRKAFDRVGLFGNRWLVGEDMSWILHAKEQKLRMIMLPELLYLRRLHENNKGITHRQFNRQRVQIIKASLDRRRRGA